MENYLVIALVWFCYVIRLNDEQIKIVKNNIILLLISKLNIKYSTFYMWD